MEHDHRFPDLRELGPIPESSSKPFVPRTGHRPAAQPPEPPEKKRTTVLVLIGVLAGVGSVATGGSPPSVIVLFNYVLVFAAVFCWSSLIGFWANARWSGDRAPSRSLLPPCVAVAAGIAACIWWGSYDAYQSRWHDEDGSLFIDTIHRFGEHPTHRLVLFKHGPEVIWDSAEGDRTPSGKMHGEWVFDVFPKDGHPTSKHEWYWYGDKVSEGEWHLRNR